MGKNFVVVTLLATLLFLTLYRAWTGITTSPIQRWDEATNIEVIQDTIARRSFPILYLNDAPFFEKPPLWYWMGISIGQITGVNVFALRFMSSAAGLLLIFCTFWVAYRWWGLISAIVTWMVLLCSGQLFVVNAGGFFSSHTLWSADVDSVFIAFLFLSFVAAIQLHESRLAARFAGLFAGLSVLAKGPLGIVPLVYSTLDAIFMHRERSMTHVMQAWGVFMLTTVPWYILMTVLFGAPFLSQHIAYHLGVRSVLPLEGHDYPWWYYGSILVNRNVFFSWELLVFPFVWLLFDRMLRADRRVTSVAIMAVVLFFVPALVRTRLAWYILPVYPFVALLVGAAVNQVYVQASRKLKSKKLRIDLGEVLKGKLH